MKHILILSALLSAGAMAESYSALCDLSVYRPSVVVRAVSEQLRERGIAVTELGSLGHSSGRLGVMRAGALYGQVSFREDVRTATSEVVFYDPAGSVIASFVERTIIGGGNDNGSVGRRKVIEIRTELDNAKDVKPKAPAFSLVATPVGRLEHYRYGTLVSPYDWRLQFKEMFSWLRETLANPRLSLPYIVKTGEDRFRLGLLSDVVTSPYADRISISRGRDRWILRGTVPSNHVYGRVIDLARAAGYLYLDPQMTINTGTYARDLYLLAGVASCYW